MEPNNSCFVQLVILIRSAIEGIIEGLREVRTTPLRLRDPTTEIGLLLQALDTLNRETCAYLEDLHESPPDDPLPPEIDWTNAPPY